jgi:hyperosmotically inducible periplasmic protein
MHIRLTKDPGHISRSARLIATFVCIGALTACAGSRESDPPPATAATEPESPPPADPAAMAENQKAIDRAAATSEQLADQTASQTENARDHAAAPAGLPQSPEQRMSEGSAQPQGAADNTAKNERDREGAAPTAGDQSNQTSDVELAAKVRRAIVGTDDLSMNARNVKIITEGGRITLRGPVKSAAEKSRVEQTARQAAGSARVVSELEIEK